MHDRWSRRRFIAVAGAAGLAGCSSSNPSTTNTSTGTGTTTTAEPQPPDYDLSTDHDAESWGRYDPEWEAPSSSPLTGDVGTEILVENLEIPWDLSFTGNGEVFITERVGRIKSFADGEVQNVTAPVDAIDAESVEPGEEEQTWWVEGGEGGTLGVAAHPDYPDPPVVYAYYTYQDGDNRYNKIAYFDVSADDPSRRAGTLIDGIPADNIHNGGRITFGPANYLWVGTGDAGRKPLARDPESLAGKILRLTPEGDPAPDNPDVGDPRVYTYGHRNPQGITFLPDASTVIDEHGPSAHDEVNLLAAGDDYGWPDVRTREEYEANEDVHPPLMNTPRSIAPSGSVFYTGDAVPEWSNRMIIGTLTGQRIHVVTLTPEGTERPPTEDGTPFDAGYFDDAYTATSHRAFENELGRVRHVEQGPNGELYAITSNRDGRSREGFPTERDDVLVRFTVDGE